MAEQTPIQKRRELRKRIDALMGKRSPRPSARPDRETLRKERELERALDEAIQRDCIGKDRTT